MSSGVGADIRLYFTAPLRWNATDWALFGGALLAVGAAYSVDGRVRTHFTQGQTPGQSSNTHDWQDALPTVAVLGGTWAFANLVDDNAGRREAWNMFEAAALSTATAYALKYATGREAPDDTSATDQWFKHGRSFPSEHATMAFAVGTVLAESGNDDYRWLRRVIGYSLGVFTSYERLRHNAHWLSDTVAGGALGAASASFTLRRKYPSDESRGWTVVPVQGGALLTYHAAWQ